MGRGQVRHQDVVGQLLHGECFLVCIHSSTVAWLEMEIAEYNSRDYMTNLMLSQWVIRRKGMREPT